MMLLAYHGVILKMSYDPMDFQSDIAVAYWQIWHERQTCMDAASYEAATSFCDNCPKTADRRDVFDWHRESEVAYSCCKDEPDYQESEMQYISRCTKAMDAIRELLGDAAETILEAARKA